MFKTRVCNLGYGDFVIIEGILPDLGETDIVIPDCVAEIEPGAFDGIGLLDSINAQE